MYAPVSEFRSFEQNILIDYRQTTVWHRSRQLCFSHQWALINQLLLAALGEKSTCIRLVAIDGVEEHIQPGDSFVDDTTTGFTKDDPDLEPVPTEQAELTTSKETLLAKMEEIIHFFLDLL
jgi:hypothetical protein